MASDVDMAEKVRRMLESQAAGAGAIDAQALGRIATSLERIERRQRFSWSRVVVLLLIALVVLFVLGTCVAERARQEEALRQLQRDLLKIGS